MKLKYEFQIINVEGKAMAVPLVSDDNFRGLLHINETTADVLKALENDVTEDEIVALLKEKYSASEERIKENVKKVLDILREHSLISE